MPSFIPSGEALLRRAIDLFKSEFETTPEVAACAPGRVNLIGEHTDYNDGLVLPMALPLVTIIVGAGNVRGEVRLHTSSDDVESPHKVKFSLEEARRPGKPKWTNYIRGVIANFKESEVPGFDAVIVSSIPVGGGVSSSAALEVATYTFLEALVGKKADRLIDKALACQKAEHVFAGTPCGIMDQFTSVMGQSGSALFIDCRSLESTLVPLDDPDVLILITNSNVKHELSSSEYSKRRSRCEEAASLLGLKSLRDASNADLTRLKQLGASEVLVKRAKHVISEMERTEKAKVALQNNDFTKFGDLMKESHFSLRDDYEVSCKELDCIVDASLCCEGVYGSKMTGGGFGGCVVTMLQKTAVERCIESIKRHYSGDPVFYICRPSAGSKQMPIIPN